MSLAPSSLTHMYRPRSGVTLGIRLYRNISMYVCNVRIPCQPCETKQRALLLILLVRLVLFVLLVAGPLVADG